MTSLPPPPVVTGEAILRVADQLERGTLIQPFDVEPIQLVRRVMTLLWLEGYSIQPPDRREAHCERALEHVPHEAHQWTPERGGVVWCNGEPA